MALVTDADDQERMKKLKLTQSFNKQQFSWTQARVSVLIRNHEVRSLFWTVSEVLQRMDSPCLGLLFMPNAAFSSV